MTHTVRAPLTVMYASISALTIRDIQKKFIKTVNTQRSLAFLWIILEPISHIAIWMFIFSLMGRGLHAPPSMSLPVFIILGAMPFLIFRTIIGSSKNSIKGNKGFYLFRQVKPIDPLIAKVISEFLIAALVFIVLLVGFSWFGIKWRVYHFQFWLINVFAFAAFLLGLSLILAIACFFFNFISTLLDVLMRLAYVLSGVFFTADMLPKQLRDIMLYNPLFQFVELSRECFQPKYSYIPYASSSYLFACALVALILGMSLYLSLRTKIMTEIEQR